MVDLLQNSIRNGCSVPDFTKQMSRLVTTERANDQHEEVKEDPTNNKKQEFELDLESLGSNGFNCLHIACGSGHRDMVKFLLQMK